MGASETDTVAVRETQAEAPLARRHVPYAGLPRQKLDLYLPKSGPVKATILYLYGGGWVSGARWYYRLFGRAMAARGFAVVVPDYHLFPKARFPAFVEDAALAFKWTLDNVGRWRGDRARVFVMGHSAGAHISMMLALEPKFLAAQGIDRSAIKGVIGLAGPYTLNPFKWRGVKDIFAPAAQAPDSARPIKLVNAGAPPMLLLHGERDRVVGAQGTVNFAAALNGAGARAKAVLYPKIGHFEIFGAYLPLWRWRASVLKDTEAFIEEQLRR